MPITGVKRDNGMLGTGTYAGEYSTDLECVEITIPVQVHLRSDPLPCALVLLIKAHEEHSVNRVYDGVTNSAGLREIRALVAERVVFIVPHSIALCFR